MIRLRVVGFAVPVLALLACLVALPGCGRFTQRDKVAAMGIPVNVGPLTYTAIESEWRDTLESSSGQRIPKSRFLLIHVTVVNNAPEERAAPLLQLEDAKGQIYPEITEGDGVPEWLGYLRLLQTREIRSGRLLFDVPPGAYRLRVASGGEPETEQTALIDIPLELGTVAPTGPGATSFGDVVANPQIPASAPPAKK